MTVNSTVLLSESGLPGEVDLQAFLQLGERLALKLAEIHAGGAIPQSIEPESISLKAATLDIEFLGATRPFRLLQVHPGFRELFDFQLHPAFVSPEQTGRMNRTVDYRSNLYSLGALFYYLATGRPPFEDTDPLRLVHAHLARMPESPGDIVSWMPACLSRVILKLLAKEPEERY